MTQNTAGLELIAKMSPYLAIGCAIVIAICVSVLVYLALKSPDKSLEK